MKNIESSIRMSRRQFIKSTILYCTATLVFPSAFASGALFKVIVDINKCNGCEECVEVCPADVFEMVAAKASPVNAEECLGCESCVEVCEPGAILVTSLDQRGSSLSRCQPN